jgi:hypothetical protein
MIHDGSACMMIDTLHDLHDLHDLVLCMICMICMIWRAPGKIILLLLFYYILTIYFTYSAVKKR